MGVGGVIRLECIKTVMQVASWGSPGPAVEPNGPPETLVGLVEVGAGGAPGCYAEPKPACDPPHDFGRSDLCWPSKRLARRTRRSAASARRGRGSGGSEAACQKMESELGTPCEESETEAHTMYDWIEFAE